jgi:hypothetical protein
MGYTGNYELYGPEQRIDVPADLATPACLRVAYNGFMHVVRRPHSKMNAEHVATQARAIDP